MSFGCERCWPPSAEEAWAARSTLTQQREWIDESHFRVVLLACPRCSQRFVSVFTETVDWADGDDPQYWTVLPVTAAEVERLEASAITESALNALAPERRSLRRDHPKAANPRTYWTP